MNNLKILGLIPARGESKGIPNKNIAKVGGLPLIAYTIKAALASKLIDKLIVSTDSKKIAQIAREYNAETPFIRPKYVSTDTTPAIDVINNALSHLKKNEQYIPDAVMYLQPTSPLRKTKHIDEAIKKFNKFKKADSLVSVIKPPHNFHPIKLMSLNDKYLEPFIKGEGTKKQDRHNMPALFARNGPAILISKLHILKNNDLYGNNILPYEMDEISSHDIDELNDLKLLEFYLKPRHHN